jgi:uracil phosphoribosyltransferase
LLERLLFLNLIKRIHFMATELKDHPLIQHYLTILRDRSTPTADFRRASSGITRVLVMEAAKLLEMEVCEVQTPIEVTQGANIIQPVVFVPILRAGLGMLDVAMEIIPDSTVGYIGLERDEDTAVASCYYSKVPEMKEAKHVFLLDPMLATGGSAAQSIEQLKELGAERITMVCIISAPEGVDLVEAAYPDVEIVTGVIDRELDENRYICPGLGDFGDRLFGT